ncbi:hypothetical protein, partial [Vibrio cholerae]|uniref:hypothetical protein n=1 Tax=Vibrio cholerae TaxID=666 RepID=UPI0015A17671
AVAGGAFSGGLTRLDGDDLGERYGVWDVLSFEGRDLRAEPYATRLRFRAEVLARAPGLLPVVTACTTQEKRDLLAHLIASNME